LGKGGGGGELRYRSRRRRRGRERAHAVFINIYTYMYIYTYICVCTYSHTFTRKVQCIASVRYSSSMFRSGNWCSKSTSHGFCKCLLQTEPTPSCSRRHVIEGAATPLLKRLLTCLSLACLTLCACACACTHACLFVCIVHHTSTYYNFYNFHLAILV